MKMKIYDVSMPITEAIPVYKNNPEKRPQLETTADFSSHGFHETRVHMDVHTGTHLDAPLHMVENGASIDSLSLEQLVRSCRVLDLTHVTDRIVAADLVDQAIEEGEFLLLKTKNSHRDLADGFDFEFVFVSEDAARYLAEQKVAGVGVDGLGVERSQSGHPTHKILFEQDSIILEGLQLGEVPAGSYLMVAAPLKLVGVDAAPARVLLIENL